MSNGNQYLFPDQQPVMQSPIISGGPPGTGSGVGSFFGNLLNLGGSVGEFLGGAGGSLIGAGLNINELNQLRDVAQQAATGMEQIGQRGAEAAAFRPFTVSTGFGGVTTTPEGGFTTALSPAMAAQQQALQGITSGLLGGMGAPSAFYQGNQRALGQQPLPVMGDVQISPIEMQRTDPRLMGGMDFMEFTALPVEDRLRIRQEGLDAIAAEKPPQPAQPPQAPTAPATGGFGAGIPDVSGITRQALGGVGGFLTGVTAPMAQREADVYERIRATQRPEEQRQQLALEERLAAQGRTGLRTAQFGGSPEQFALAQAQEEAKARASLAALEQAQAEQLQQAGLAESLFGLGGRAAGLPSALQAAQLQNIISSQAAQFQPEQQLLASLTPGIQLASLADLGRRQGAGLLTEAGVSGLEDIVGAEQARAQNLSQIYSALLGAQGQQAAARAGGVSAGLGGLFGEIGAVGSDLLDLLGIS